MSRYFKGNCKIEQSKDYLKGYFGLLNSVWNRDILAECKCYQYSPISEEEVVEFSIKLFEFMNRESIKSTPYAIHLPDTVPSYIITIYELITYLCINYNYHGCFCRRCVMNFVKEAEGIYGSIYQGGNFRTVVVKG